VAKSNVGAFSGHGDISSADLARAELLRQRGAAAAAFVSARQSVSAERVERLTSDLAQAAAADSSALAGAGSSENDGL
jgi:hypothetical protein